MKKIILVLLALVSLLAMTFVACDDSSKKEKIYIELMNPITDEYISNKDKSNVSWEWNINSLPSDEAPTVRFKAANKEISVPKSDSKDDYPNKLQYYTENYPKTVGDHHIQVVVDTGEGDYANKDYTGSTLDVYIKIKEEAPDFVSSKIEIGENKSLELNVDEIKYFSIEPEQLGAYDLNIDSEGRFRTFVAFGHPDNKILTASYQQSVKGSFFANLEGIYYLCLQNELSSALNVTISINAVTTELKSNTPIENTGIFERIYLIKPEYTSVQEINAIGQYNQYVDVYDSNFSLLASDSGISVKLSRILTGGEIYYVSLNPSVNMTSSIYSSPIPTNLQLGSNNLSGFESTVLLGYKSTDTDVVINLSEVSVDSVKLYDSAMNETSDNLFLEGQQYYIGVKGISNDSTLNLSVALSNNSGIIPSEGFVFVEFDCDRTGNYNTTGDSLHEWYSSDYLFSHHNYLSAGNKYYLKIQGEAGEAYSVTIFHDVAQLSLGVKQNIDAGYYKIVVEDDGDYSFQTYSSAGVITTMTIYDSNNSVVYSNVDASTEKIFDLNEGVYYIDIFIENSTHTTIEIIQQ